MHCTALHHAMPYYATLCHATHTTPHHTPPHHIITHHTMPYYVTPHHTTPHHTTPHHTTPHHITTHHTTPHHITLHHTTPHHTCQATCMGDFRLNHHTALFPKGKNEVMRKSILTFQLMQIQNYKYKYYLFKVTVKYKNTSLTLFCAKAMHAEVKRVYCFVYY